MIEIINDTNGEIANFYEVLKRDFAALEKEVAISLHSRKQHRQARVIYENPDMFDRIKRAWAVWMTANGSYAVCWTAASGTTGRVRVVKN